MKRLEQFISDLTRGDYSRRLEHFADLPKDMILKLNQLAEALESDVSAKSKRLEYILEGSGLGSWDWWLETNRVNFDKRWCEMLGLNLEMTPQELSTWDSRVHPDDKARAYQDIQDYLAGKTALYENIHRMKHEEGHWIWILDRGRISEYDKSGKPTRFTGTHFEITNYKESQQISDSIQSIAKIGGWELDAATGKTRWTSETYRIHDLPEDTPTDTMMGISFFSEADQERIQYLVEDCLKGKPYRDTFRFVDAKGKFKWVEATGEPVFDAKGNVYKLMGTFQDVSERVKVTQELEQAELIGKFGSWELNLKTNEAHWSNGHKVLFESDSDGELNFDYFLSKLHPDDREIPVQLMEQVRNGRIERFRTQYRLLQSNGDIKHIEGFGEVKFDVQNNPEKIIGTVQDVTESVQLKQSLELERAKTLHSAKLASLGEMSAGIAHEINNPLTIVLGNLHLIKRDISNQNQSNDFLNRVQNAEHSAKRIEKIVKGLKRFSRSHEGTVFRSVSLQKIILDSLVIIEPKLKREGVAVLLELKEDIIVSCDAVEMEQVFVNLVSNGIDAAKNQNEKWVKIKVLKNLKQVLIQIIDSGNGISPEIESKLFQPFFTTKEVGEGTGLGLSIVKGILDQHQASICLNRSTRNTCFEVRLPVLDTIAQEDPDVQSLLSR